MKALKHSLISIFLISSLLLTACGQIQDAPLQDVNVELSNEAKTEVSAQVQSLEEELAKQKAENDIDFLKVVELARAYESLGQITKTAQIYEDFLAERSNSTILNNLGVLYEEHGQYTKAIAQYQRLVDEYDEPDYLNKIARVYAQAKNARKAKEAYEAWKKATGSQDALTEQILEAL